MKTYTPIVIDEQDITSYLFWYEWTWGCTSLALWDIWNILSTLRFLSFWPFFFSVSEPFLQYYQASRQNSYNAFVWFFVHNVYFDFFPNCSYLIVMNIILFNVYLTTWDLVLCSFSWHNTSSFDILFPHKWTNYSHNLSLW